MFIQAIFEVADILKSFFHKQKKPQLKRVVPYLFLILGLSGKAQMECMLGVGGPDEEIIAQVFQLNDEQREKLKNWGAELKVRNDILRDKADHLMKQNADSPPEVLVAISQKYQEIRDSMEQNVRMMDKRLLAIFNERQYKRYVELCSELSLRPIHVNRPMDEN